MSGQFAVTLAAALLLAVLAAVLVVRTRRVVATPTERAVHAALHTASLAARALRQGLDTGSAATAAPFLRDLTGTDGVALFDGDGQLLSRDPAGLDVARGTAQQRGIHARVAQRARLRLERGRQIHSGRHEAPPSAVSS